MSFNFSRPPLQSLVIPKIYMISKTSKVRRFNVPRAPRGAHGQSFDVTSVSQAPWEPMDQISRVSRVHSVTRAPWEPMDKISKVSTVPKGFLGVPRDPTGGIATRRSSKIPRDPRGNSWNFLDFKHLKGPSGESLKFSRNLNNSWDFREIQQGNPGGSCRSFQGFPKGVSQIFWSFTSS